MTRDLGTLARWWCDVRAHTEALAAPLSPEDQTAQSMPDVSPTKWHRAHTTWFFETFLLEPHDPVHRAFDPAYRMMFNSYYEGVGPQYPRDQRGAITRPGAAEVGAYRRCVDERVLALVERCRRGGMHDDAATRAVAALVELGGHHEQQHQELLLMDIKHVLSRNPTEPVYRPGPPNPDVPHPPPAGWSELDGGLVEVGHDPGAGFAFDNEGPRHRAYLAPYRLADRLVTAGEWRAFIDDGGYHRPELWLSDGWHTVQREGWEAPLYWRRDADGWVVHTLHGTRPVADAEPVCHVSMYEADAFARWAGARLPTEAEWEHAAARSAAQPSAEPSARSAAVLHPQPCTAGGAGMRQLHGVCWQWTASAYLAYPGFAPAAGAVGEYNGKFMSGQAVLRGSSALTPPGHARDTYRNFFPPHARWPMTGVRLAADVHGRG